MLLVLELLMADAVLVVCLLTVLLPILRSARSLRG